MGQTTKSELQEVHLTDEAVQWESAGLPLPDPAQTPDQSPVSESPLTGSGEDIADAAASLPSEPAAKPEPPPLPLPAHPAEQKIPAQVYVTRPQAFLLAFLSSGLTLLVTGGVTLLILFVINGGLQFAPLAAFNNLNNQVAQLGTQAQGLEQDLQLVQSRLKVVDELSVQVSGMESEVTGLKLDVQSAQAAVKEIAGDVDQLSQDLDVLTTQVNVFQKFLAGLRSLINSLTTLPNP